MSPEKLQSIAFKWVDAFNNQELEKLLSLYDDEASLYIPQLKLLNPNFNSVLKGRQAIRKWFEDMFVNAPTLYYKVKSVTANGDRVFVEYTQLIKGESDLQVAEVLDIREDKITASRVYNG